MLTDWLPPWALQAVWWTGVALMFGGGVGFIVSARSMSRRLGEHLDRYDTDIANVHTRLDRAGAPGAGAGEAPAKPLPLTSAARATDAAVAELKTTLGLPAPDPETQPEQPVISYAIAPPEGIGPVPARDPLTPTFLPPVADPADQPTPAQHANPTRPDFRAQKPVPATNPLGVPAQPSGATAASVVARRARHAAPDDDE